MENEERGFSLIELLVAMTATLVITGAVFQLVSAGQTAFRREPALAERQQNIRVALDVISHDLYRAGYGAPTFAQVFTDGLDGAGPAGSSGQASDILELFTSSECGPIPVCNVPGNGSVSMTLVTEISGCYKLPGLVLVADEEKWAMRWAHNPGTSSSCPGSPGGAKNGRVNFPPGKAPLVNPPGGFGGWIPDYMLPGEAIRYRLNLDADGIPNLERSAFGGQLDLAGRSTWEVIARGIEDMQVEYQLADNAVAWLDEPGLVAPHPRGDTIVGRVRVRLSARVVGGGQMIGETTSAVGTAVRGELETEVAPRPAAIALGILRGEM